MGIPLQSGGGPGPERFRKSRETGGVSGGGGGAQGGSEEQERGVSEGPGLTPPSPA